MLDFNDAARQQPFEDAMARKERVYRTLQGRVREFVRYLYPRATMGPRDARIGDVTGSKGLSLSISLTADETAGKWIDHATGDRGDVFGLYAVAHNLDVARDFAQILAECDAWAGGTPAPRAIIRHEVEASRPIEPEPERTVDARYVYRDKAGRKICEVVRYRLSNGKKNFAVPGGMPSPRPLYGLERWHAADCVVIVEGEKCVDALASIGVDAASLMGGANTSLDKADLTPLAGKKVVLWPDADEPGRKLMAGLEGPLRAIGCSVRVLGIPSGKADGWDAADAIAEGFDVAGFLREPETSSAILHELWPDISFVYEPELVEDLFPRVGLGTIYGPSTAGKTFVTLDWMASIATGRQLFGRDTEPVGVLYFAFEGYYGIRKRISGIKQEKGYGPVALELVDAPWTLSDADDWSGLRAHIVAARERLEQTGFGLGIIVVDTLTAAYAGIDANSQAEVTKAMRQLKRLAMDMQCLVLVVGHTGKDTTKGMVGSFAYKSESDTFIELRTEKNEGDGSIKRRSIFIEKVKDGPSDFVLSDYALIEVRIGTKPNGKPITTCVVEWVKPPEKDGEAGAKPLSKSARTILAMLFEGPKFVKEIVEETGLKRPTVQLILSELSVAKKVYAKDVENAKLWYVLETEATPQQQ